LIDLPGDVGALPNITGLETGFSFEGDPAFWTGGAFAVEELRMGTNLEGKSEIARVSFQASRESVIYGGSNVVQPSSLRVLACIKP